MPTSCSLWQRAAGASIKSYDPLNASYSTFIGRISHKMLMNERFGPNIRARYSYDGIKRNPKSTLRWKRNRNRCAFKTCRVTRPPPPQWPR